MAVFSPRLDRLLERAKRGIDALEKKAALSVRKLYSGLNLDGLLGHLRTVLARPNPADRMREFQALSSLFDAALKGVATPPLAVLEYLKEAAELGVSTTSRVLTGQGVPRSVLSNSLNITSRYVLKIIDSVQARFGMFWAKEPSRLKVEAEGVMAEALARSQSYEQAARALTERVEASQSRAELITRNEISSAHEAGNTAVVEEARAEGVGMTKQWLAILDERTRDSHVALNGQIIPMGEDFKPGLAYPHDPRAPLNEVLRCRCQMRVIVVEA